MKFLTFFLILISFNLMASNPKEAYELIKEGKAVLIDVREEHEVNAGMVDKAHWYPLSKIENPANDWKKDILKISQAKKIYLYCQSGKRSEKVRNILRNEKIESHNLGGYNTLKDVLPIKTRKH